MTTLVEPLEPLEPLPLEPREPRPADEPAGDDPGEALIKEAKQRARRRRLLYGGIAIIVAIIAGTAVSSWSTNAAPPTGATPPVPAPPAVPLGAPLVVGPDAASTLLTSWGQFHVGYVFVYADGRVIWEPDAPVYADADGRVTAIPIGSAGVGEWPTNAQFLLTEAGLEPGGWTPEGEFDPRDAKCGVFVCSMPVNIERRLSARGLDLVRAGNIEVKHLLTQPGEQWPAELPRRPEDMEQWPVAIQLWLRPDLWAGPTARIYQPSTWAIDFHRYQPSSVEAVDATRALEQLPASAQAFLTDKRRTCDYANAGNAHWQTGPLQQGDAPTACFELNAAELAAFWPSLDPNTFINGSWHIEVDGRDAILNALPIYPHGQPQLWGG
jgi:hypothetical protein